MTETALDSLAKRFEAHRDRLQAVAYRMLGTPTEAEDAVQEAWLKLDRTDTSTVDNLGGWLTTVVARVCLDMLRSRKSRREEPIVAPADEPAAEEPVTESETALAESLGPALRVVLDRLAPPERLAFVLHDMFGVSFDEIATIVDRTPTAARQLASRARRRVQGGSPIPEDDRQRQRELVAAFFAASREGNFEALLAMLDPNVVVHADRVAVSYGTQQEIRGANDTVRKFALRARGAVLVEVDGMPNAAWVMDGAPRVVFGFTIENGKITEIELLAEPAALRDLDLRFED